MNSRFKIFENERTGTEHGSLIHAKKRKAARPIVTKAPMHVVLKSSRAKGEWNFLRAKNRALIDALVEKLAQKYGIRVMAFENVGSHLHLLIQGKSRPLLRSFLQEFPAKLALGITGAKKGNPIGRFFDSIFFSRVVHWGRDLKRTLHYFTKNRLEAVGVNQKFLDWWKAFAKELPA